MSGTPATHEELLGCNRGHNQDDLCENQSNERADDQVCVQAQPDGELFDRNTSQSHAEAEPDGAQNDRLQNKPSQLFQIRWRP